MQSRPGINSDWAIALLGGSLINLSLFTAMPLLNGAKPAPQAAITVEFVPAPMRAARDLPPHPKASSRKSEPAPAPRAEPESEAEPDAPKKETAPEETSRPDEAAEEALPTPVPIFQLTSMPKFVHRQLPQYPVTMKDQGREGTVKLSVLIDAEGRLRQVTVLQSAGEAFDRAAINALQSSSFTPGNVDGQPVPVLLKIPVTFKLR